MKTERIDGIHVLRGFATVSIVACHALERLCWPDMSPLQISGTLIASHFVIYLFFAISGMIILYTQLQNFGAENASKNFLIRRFVRVIPLYYIATLIEFGLRAVTGKAATFTALAASAAFIPYPTSLLPDSPWRPVLGVAWTLNYEVLYYLIVAVCLCFSRKIGMLLLCAITIAIVVSGFALRSPLDVSEPHTLMTIWTSPIFLILMFGALIGNNFERLRKLDISPNLAQALTVAVLVTVAALSVMWAPSPYTVEKRAIFWVAVLALLAISVAARNMPEGRVRSAGMLLGDASYSIYLFHFFFIVLIEKLWRLAGGPPHPAIYFLSGLAGSVALGIVVYFLLEKPLTAISRDIVNSGWRTAWQKRWSYVPPIARVPQRLALQIAGMPTRWRSSP